MFDNGYDSKRYFPPLLKDFDIKPVLATIKYIYIYIYANAPMKRVHQVILNMLVTKYINNKVLDYIDPWCETLVYIV